MHRVGQMLGIAAVAIAGVCSTANAQNANAQNANAQNKPPVVIAGTPPAAIVNWTGFYFGADAGRDFTSTRFKRPTSGLSDTSVGDLDLKPAVSAFVGFNYQVLPWAVIGVEGSKTWLGSANYRELGPSLDLLQESHYIETVGARVGVLMRPDTMVYGKLGPAWIDVRGFQGFVSNSTFAQTLDGFQAAIGVETMVTPNVAVRAEGAYTRADQVLSLNQGSALYRPTFLMFQVGAEYKFDAPGGWGAQAAAAYAATPPFGAFTPVWTGFEVGGFASLNGDYMTYIDSLGGELGPYAHLGLGGGGFIAANYEYMQHIVVGVEASANYDSAAFYNAAGAGGLAGNFYHFASDKGVVALTARAGWLLSPTTLIYGKGGPAWISTSTNADYWNNIAPNATGKEMLPGYQIGVGMETFVTSNVSVRVEGLYTHVGSNLVLNGTITPEEFSLQPKILAATTGVALHF